MSHVAVIASFTPMADSRHEVRSILEGMIDPTRAEDGCLQYDLYADETGFHLFERYEDRAAIEHHQGTDHYRAYRAAIADLLAAPIAVVVAEPVDAEPDD